MTAAVEAGFMGLPGRAHFVVADMPAFQRLLRSGSLDRFLQLWAALHVPDYLAAAIKDLSDPGPGRWLADNAGRVTVHRTPFGQAVGEAFLLWHVAGRPPRLKPTRVRTQAQTWFAVEVFLKARDAGTGVGVVLLSDLPYARLVAGSVHSQAELHAINWLP